MRIAVLVNHVDISDSIEVTSVSIDKGLTDRISTASFTIIVKDPAHAGKYDVSKYDQCVYGGAVFQELDDVLIGGVIPGGYSPVLFRGMINRLEYARESSHVLKIQCSCQDYAADMERAIAPIANYINQTDRLILTTLIIIYCPRITAAPAFIAETTPPIARYVAESKSVRQIVEDICELTGLSWQVSNGYLLYFTPTTYPAPFGLSSAPDGASTFGIDAFTEYVRDFIRPVNRCTVIGGIGTVSGGGTGTINMTFTDAASISQYGIHELAIVDRDITTEADALLRATVEVTQQAYPEESFTVKTFKDGLDVGQSIPVYHSDYGVNGTYLIRGMRIRQRTRILTEYELDIGVKPPDLVTMLRKLEARTRQPISTGS